MALGFCVCNVTTPLQQQTLWHLRICHVQTICGETACNPRTTPHRFNTFIWERVMAFSATATTRTE